VLSPRFSSPQPAPARPTRRRRLAALACVLALGLGFAGDAHPQAPEVRATWLTTTGPDHIRSGLFTEATLRSLRDIGLNTVYVEAWKNGFTNFDSQVMDDLIGVDRSAFLGSRDLLDETAAHAHRNGMAHIAWFEYGFSSQFIGSGGTPSNALSQYMLNQSRTINGQNVTGYLLQDQNGNYANASNGFAWMNPAVPEVRQLLIDLTLEAIGTHDLDGIQFDDRLAWPRQFGWDPTTAAIYKQETGRNLPSNINDAHFRAWRQGKVTQFAQELYTAVKARRPDMHVSVSPSITGFSDVNFNAVWSDWVEMGLFDEFVPQVYRDNINDFDNTLPSNIQPFTDAGREQDMVVGIRFNGSGADTPLADVQQMIVESALAAGGDLAGHSLFFSKGLIDNAAAMSSFYGNQRDNPFFGPNWRPDPLIATPDTAEPDAWHVTVTDPEQYRVLVKRGSFWTEALAGLLLEAGGHTISVADADQVELVLDRRPIPGDVNFDRVVDQQDLSIIADNWQSAGFLPQGDINDDGLIDEFDLALLTGNWNWGVGAGAVSLDAALAAVTFVPEPGALSLLMAGLMIFTTRRRSAKRWDGRPARRLGAAQNKGCQATR